MDDVKADFPLEFSAMAFNVFLCDFRADEYLSKNGVLLGFLSVHGEGNAVGWGGIVEKIFVKLADLWDIDKVNDHFVSCNVLIFKDLGNDGFNPGAVDRKGRLLIIKT